MIAFYNFFFSRGIRLGTPLSLIFFALFLAGCRQKATEELGLRWSGGRATGITIPQSLLANGTEENIKRGLQVRLQESGVPMLGDYSLSGEAVLFTPLLPLSPGRQYAVFYNKSRIGQLMVPVPDKRKAPEVTALYPSVDTVPENLLKLYLRFSLPMREGDALRHIHLLGEKGDTVPDVFLDLQPELWNREGTTLTLWLDPGRIKRDLIPNRRLGNPLQKGRSYRIVIDSAWKDAQGLALKQGYTKRFFAGERDQTSPQPDAWTIEVPTRGSADPLRIHLKEPLDYFLLAETVRVVDEAGSVMATDVRVMQGEKGMEIFAKEKWAAGRYRIKIASYLEDLAGNNLNRLFDRDVTKPQKTQRPFRELAFVIR